MAYDLVKRSDELRDYHQSFILSPKQWAACTLATPMVWQWVVFAKAERPKVPKVRGLYAFVIRPTVKSIFDHGYLMYVGQTGHGSPRTLYDRFDQYFQDTLIRKRPKIARMMEKWHGHILFYFVPLQAVPDLKSIETGLNDALVPPCVTGDFSPEIREAVKAF